MEKTASQGTLGFRLIGSFKLACAVLLAAAGLGLFRLLGRDLGSETERLVLHLHLDPENRVLRPLLDRIGGIAPSRMKWLVAAAFFYAILECVEGVGLLLRRRWASYLTILATALLLIPEIYELFDKVSTLRIAILIGNLAILAYVTIKVRQELASNPAPSPTATT